MTEQNLTDGKLVRNKIPAIIRAEGREPVVRTLNDAEYKAALDAKLLEEAAELRACTTPGDMIEELADVLEVLHGIATFHGLPWPTIVIAKNNKQAARGGFSARQFLEF